MKDKTPIRIIASTGKPGLGMTYFALKLSETKKK